MKAQVLRDSSMSSRRCRREVNLFRKPSVLCQRYADDKHHLTVHALEPVPPNYYISVVSYRWLYVETRLPISFKHLILPERFTLPIPLLVTQALPLSALHSKEFESL